MGSGASALIVDVDVERLPKELRRGPRWVSLNSRMDLGQFSFKLDSGPHTFGEIPRHDYEAAIRTVHR